MGCGDWNDGMNRVGEGGQGESVWLGFFAFDVLQQFARLAQRRGDSAFALHCSEQATALRLTLDSHGWDGGWYRRAYFDDGQPLGSASNDRMPNRLHCPELGGAVRRRRPKPLGAGHGGRWTATWCAATSASCNC